MDKTQLQTFDAYEENVLLNDKISQILASPSSSYKKYKLLNELKASVHTPLALSHIDYYQQQLKVKQHTLAGKILLCVSMGAYFFFTLYWMYFYASPENRQNTSSIRLFPSADLLLVYIMIFVPLCIFIYYITQYFSSKKTYAKRTLGKYIPGFLIFFAVSIYISLIYWENTIENNNNASDNSTKGNIEMNNNTFPDEDTNSFDSSMIYPHDFLGEWMDINSQRCELSISNTAVDHNQYFYNIEICWSNSAWESIEWRLSGIFDETTNSIIYTGDCIRVVCDDEGNLFKEFIYTNGSGTFYLKENLLYWDDFVEAQGKDCVFEKLIY